MLDPFPLSASPVLSRLVTPLATRLSLPTLPLHVHEVLLAAGLYHLTYTTLSPFFSSRLFPRAYSAFPRRTRLNWDVHVVSLLQSTIINALALWVMWTDEERAHMDATERVWGYTGASGLVQAFATGYFVWDLVVSAVYVSVFGVGMLAHAVAALAVFSLGFRPFLNFYGPTFILYELSSPFLNVHWFCDKLDLTGSRLQLVNGICLLASFASARLVWGSYQSVRVFADIFATFRAARTRAVDAAAAVAGPLLDDAGAAQTAVVAAQAAVDAVPVWLVAAYLGANLTLNGLNWYWYGKMIATVRKRFPPPWGTKRVGGEGEKGRAAGEKEGRGKAGREGEWDGEDSVLVEGVEVEDLMEGVEGLEGDGALGLGTAMGMGIGVGETVVRTEGERDGEVEKTEVRRRKA
ncbi:TLC domain-containing protein [Lineolata rhizophorae]|uniref:TLC domain-containing protein n=1 Tax=Lineolata rhizophorae TaxID=578093 RepID=A0A6A6P4F9_9PEZI|nr:TLC domain-containing protein [Lineolata rhizophorae]